MKRPTRFVRLALSVLAALAIVLLCSFGVCAEPITEEPETLPPATAVSTERPEVAVALEMTVTDEAVSVTVTAEDGSDPSGISVRLYINGILRASEVYNAPGKLVFSLPRAEGENLYRVASEQYDNGTCVYLPAVVEQDLTPYAPALDTDFFALDAFEFDRLSGAYTLSWNYDNPDNTEGADIAALLLNGKRVDFTGEKGNLSADLSVLPNGTYEVLLRLKAGESVGVVDMGSILLCCDIVPVLRVTTDEGGDVLALLTDKWGQPLPGVSVTLYVDRIAFNPKMTDENGAVRFSYFPEEGKTVSCTVEEQDYGDCRLKAVTAVLGEEPSTEPVTGETTTTKRTYVKTTARTVTPMTNPSESLPTGNTVSAPTTTGISEDHLILLPVRYEEIVETELSVTPEGMAEYAALMMTPEVYEMYLTDAGSCLTAFVGQSSFQPSDKSVASALNAASIRGFDVKESYRLAMNLSLLCIDTKTGGEMLMPVLDADYLMRMPIPETLLTADAVAVGVYDDERGLHDLMLIDTDNGYLQFPVSSLGTVVVIGLFTDMTNDNTFLPVLLIVVGGVLLLAGLALLVLYLLAYISARRRKAAPAAAAATETETEVDEPAAPAEPEEPTEYEDIFSSEEKKSEFLKK